MTENTPTDRLNIRHEYKVYDGKSTNIVRIYYRKLNSSLIHSFLFKIQPKQEIRSVERGYLSHCFKSRSRDLRHAPYWGHSLSTVYYFQQWI